MLNPLDTSVLRVWIYKGVRDIERIVMPDTAAKPVRKLARRHSWGSPVPAEQLIRLVAGTEDHDELIRILENEVLEFPFVVQHLSLAKTRVAKLRRG